MRPIQTARGLCRQIRAAALGALALTGLASLATPGQAAVIGNNVNVDFSGGSTSFALTSGASYTLFGNNGDIFNPVDIATQGSALVRSFGAPFFNPPRPTSEFVGRGTVVYDSSLLYVAYPTKANIGASLNDTYVGLSFLDFDGTKYGYLRFNGTRLLAYGYETVAGQGITAGAAFTAPITVAVPEPASLALFGVGLAGLGLIRRRRAG